MKPSRSWRPSPFLLLSVLIHAGALALWYFHPATWPWALGILLTSHASVVAAGLLPRSRLLGPNLTRLPAASRARGEVALTIDDGPDPEVTPRVLEILARHGARASFFCIGERAAAHPELIRAIVAGGHRIENHGQHHRKHASFYGPGAWLHEVGEAQATLARLSGQLPCHFRALAGLRNPFLDPVLRRLDMRLASWTRRGYDTRSGDADCVFARLTRQLAAGDILLLHDGNAARTATGEAVILAVLPRLLELLAARQLTPVSLPVDPS
ncbi:MAG: polysaccharide deacetylase family protein [Proteobacteria bacterium]|nr:polysaccharide deacetylase family protein [Pseudomonadota bacterium]